MGCKGWILKLWERASEESMAWNEHGYWEKLGDRERQQSSQAKREQRGSHPGSPQEEEQRAGTLPY